MSKEKYLTREDYFFKLYLNKLQKFSKVEVKANQLTSLETMNSISNFDFSQYYSFDLRKLSFNLIHSENFKNFIENLFYGSELIFFIVDGARKFGALEIRDINFFNFNFDSNVDKNSVLIFLDIRLHTYLLIDLYKENKEELFDIEVKTVNILPKNISNIVEQMKFIGWWILKDALELEYQFHS